MKIGVVVPDKGGRNIFLSQVFAMLQRQTRKIDCIAWIYEDSEFEYDVTWRYRKGIEELTREGCDLILFIENDDIYHNNYVSTMVKEWRKANKPDLFGIDESVYYHLKKKKYSVLQHKGRASAFATMITNKLEIDYPKDDEKFFDLHLWRNHDGKTFTPKKPICLGIKHGIGKCAGKGHSDNFKYDNDDKDMTYLKANTNRFCFKFYKSLDEL